MTAHKIFIDVPIAYNDDLNNGPSGCAEMNTGRAISGLDTGRVPLTMLPPSVAPSRVTSPLTSSKSHEMMAFNFTLSTGRK